MSVKPYVWWWEAQECDACAWSGIGRDLRLELYEHVIQADCPACGERVLIVDLPPVTAGQIWFHRRLEEAVATASFRHAWRDADRPSRAFMTACLALHELATPDAALGTLPHRIATEPRAALLADVGGARMPPGSLRAIERCDADAFDLADWPLLFDTLADPETLRALRHVPLVTSQLVRQLPAVPTPLRVPAMLTVLATLEIEADHWHRVRADLDDAGADRRATLVRSARDVRHAGDVWDLAYRCRDAALASRMASTPDLDLGPRLERLATPEAMRREGARMDNCLARLVDRVQTGRSAYFAWLGEPRATVELVPAAGRWVLRDVAGHANTPLPADVVAQIRATIGAALGPESLEDRDPRPDASELEHGASIGRAAFPAHARTELADDLWSLRGRSVRAGDGAFVVIEGPGETYLQCLADLGTTYFVEICSHRYVPAVAPHLTRDAVAFLEDSGFDWPRAKANFQRVVRIDARADCDQLADFALGAFALLFGVQDVAQLRWRSQLPAVGAIEQAAAAHMAALLGRKP